MKASTTWPRILGGGQGKQRYTTVCKKNSEADIANLILLTLQESFQENNSLIATRGKKKPPK